MVCRGAVVPAREYRPSDLVGCSASAKTAAATRRDRVQRDGACVPFAASSPSPDVSATTTGLPSASASSTASGCVSNSLISTTTSTAASRAANSSSAPAGTASMRTRSATPRRFADSRSFPRTGRGRRSRAVASGRLRRMCGNAAITRWCPLYRSSARRKRSAAHRRAAGPFAEEAGVPTRWVSARSGRRASGEDVRNARSRTGRRQRDGSRAPAAGGARGVGGSGRACGSATSALRRGRSRRRDVRRAPAAIARGATNVWYDWRWTTSQSPRGSRRRYRERRGLCRGGTH